MPNIRAIVGISLANSQASQVGKVKHTKLYVDLERGTMAIINGNNNTPVNYPNLPTGASVNTGFAPQETNLQSDLDNLSRDKTSLDTLNASGQYLTPDQAHQATQLAANLKTDSAKFQSDQQTLLQIAAQDNDTTEAKSATGLANTANATINAAVQDAGSLESQHGLDSALGGTASSDIGTFHQNINAAAGSANQVARVNTQSPVTVTSPFTGSTNAAGSTSAAGSTNAAGSTSAAGSTNAAGSTSAAGSTNAAGSTSAAGSTNAAGTSANTGGAGGSSASVGGNPPPAIPVTGNGGSVNSSGSANTGGAGTAGTSGNAAVSSDTVIEAINISTNAGLVKENITVHVPADANGRPTTTATVQNHSIVSYSTAAGASTQTIDVTLVVGPGVSTAVAVSVSVNTGARTSPCTCRRMPMVLPTTTATVQNHSIVSYRQLPLAHRRKPSM